MTKSTRKFVTLLRAGLVGMCLLAGTNQAQAQGASVTLQWDANPESDIAGYVLRYGIQPGVYTSEINVGNSTSWTVQGLIPHYRYYFVVHAYNEDGLRSAPSAEVNNEALILQTGGSLPDARPDVFWHHRTTGDLLAWHLNGTSVVETWGLSIPRVQDTNWKIAGTGDLNGDGHQDMVWRNSSTGLLVIWFLQNSQIVSTLNPSISTVADQSWVIRGVGDLDGDRRADLVWQNETTGLLVIWFMNGATVVRSALPSIPQVTDLSWKVAGAGDVDRDGRADLIWQHHASGLIVAWLMDGGTVRQSNFLSSNASGDLNWNIEALSDVNGDGRADLIWRHATNGHIVLWYLNTYQVLGSGVFNVQSVYDQNWRLAGPS